ncbi:MAG: hypothetical protein IJZ88_02395 [Clostridia bacterium]|nr:hypothetical protein [Clostridia bacterium]
MRKDNRLKGFDYSSDGTYFITICVKDKQRIFGNIVGEAIGRPWCQLLEHGKVVEEVINNIDKIYSGVKIDKHNNYA